MNRFLMLILVVTFCACGAGETDKGASRNNGFEDKTDPDNLTRVVGQALSSDSGVSVAAFLVYPDDVVLTTRSNERGEFVFEKATPGEALIVLNDGLGSGLLDEVTLFAGGENDLGPLAISTLDDYPDLVDVFGIGYEERVTRNAGNYEFPVYSADFEHVYAARKLDGQTKWTVVEVNTTSGAERQLLKNQDLRGVGYGDPDDDTFFLAADRYLVFNRIPANSTTVAVERVVYDLVDETTVYQGSDDDLGTAFSFPPFANSTTLFFVQETGRERIQSEGAFADYALRHALYRMDLAPGSSVSRAVELNPTWSNGAWSMGNSEDHFVYSSNPACGTPGAFVSCYEIGPDAPSRLVSIDLHSLDVSTDSYSNEPHRAFFLPEGDSTYWIQNGVALHHLDLQTGLETSAGLQPCAGCSADSLVVAPAQDRILVRFYEPAATYQIVYHVLDVATGTWTPLEPQITIDGNPVDLCTATYLCDASFLADGKIRVRQSIETAPDEWVGVIVDLDSPSNMVAVRQFDIFDGDPTRLRVHPVPVIDSPIAGEDEIVPIRNIDSGFHQLWFGAPATDGAQRTFINAHHEHPAFSPDGAYVYYFTRDPISGFQQLFRLDLSTFTLLP